MRTKQQTDCVLRWMLNNEIIQITYCGEHYRDCDYTEVFTQLSCTGTSAEFRIKPEIPKVPEVPTFYADSLQVDVNHITSTYLVSGDKGASTYLQDILKESSHLKIVSEKWYNEQINKPNH